MRTTARAASAGAPGCACAPALPVPPADRQRLRRSSPRPRPALAYAAVQPTPVSQVDAIPRSTTYATLRGEKGDATVTALSISRRSFGVSSTVSAPMSLQALQFTGAGDGSNPGLLGKQPRQCDLGGRRVLSLRDAVGQIDYGLVCLASLRVKRGIVLRVSVLVNSEFSSILQVIKSLSQWAEGDEADPDDLVKKGAVARAPRRQPMARRRLRRRSALSVIARTSIPQVDTGPSAR